MTEFWQTFVASVEKILREFGKNYVINFVWLLISAKTVETHRMQLMKRLDIHDVAGLVRYAIRMGLVISDS